MNDKTLTWAQLTEAKELFAQPKGESVQHVTREEYERRKKLAAEGHPYYSQFKYEDSVVAVSETGEAP